MSLVDHNLWIFVGFTTPSGVQAACVPAIISGENLIANSPTGTGKTLTFAIPVVQRCNVDPHPGFSLVLTPTRELASQIADQFRSIGGTAPGVTCVIGGVDFQEQSKELETRPLHIIATPGRYWKSLVLSIQNEHDESSLLFLLTRILPFPQFISDWRTTLKVIKRRRKLYSGI